MAEKSLLDLLSPVVNTCTFEELTPVEQWLTGKICACSTCTILSSLMSFIPLVIVVCAPSLPLECDSIIISIEEAVNLKPLEAPSLQRVFVIASDGNKVVETPTFPGRRVLLLLCGMFITYVKTEFEPALVEIPTDQLSKKFFSDEIDPNREVIITTFNCTVFSQSGPLSPEGKPSWFNGLELSCLVLALEWRGLRWRLRPSSRYGKVYSNGSLESDGLKGMLAEGMADIGVCSLWFTPSLAKMLSSTSSTRERACSRLLVPRPTAKAPHWLAPAMGLPVHFWVVHLFCSGLTAIILHVYYIRTGSSDYSYWNSCYQTFRMCFQGFAPNLTTRFDYRILQLSWAFLVLLSFNFFSCFLMAKLMDPLLPEPIESLKELLRLGYNWTSGFIPLQSGYELVFDIRDQTARDWVKTQVSSEQIVDGWTALYTQDLGYICFIANPEVFTKKFLNSLIAVKKCFGYNQISMGTRRLSSYNKWLSDVLMQFYEFGLYNKITADVLRSPIMKRYILPNAHRVSSPSKGGTPLGLVELRGAFYLLLGGLLISSIVFIVEHIVARKCYVLIPT